MTVPMKIGYGVEGLFWVVGDDKRVDIYNEGGQADDSDVFKPVTLFTEIHGLERIAVDDAEPFASYIAPSSQQAPRQIADLITTAADLDLWDRLSAWAENPQTPAAIPWTGNERVINHPPYLIATFDEDLIVISVNQFMQDSDPMFQPVAREIADRGFVKLLVNKVSGPNFMSGGILSALVAPGAQLGLLARDPAYKWLLMKLAGYGLEIE